jgi:arylsulfatase A-like enzyme
MKVLVLTARGLPLAYLGCYGNTWIETPALDALAAQSVVFDQHLADRPDAAGAALAWRTGRHALPQEQEPPQTTADLSPLPERARTCLVIDASRPERPGFAQGWHEVVRAAPEGDETPLERTIEEAAAALDRLAGVKHWLLWVDLATVLPRWNVPAEFIDHYFRAPEPDDEEEPDEGEPLQPLLDPSVGPVDPNDDDTFLRLQKSCAAAVSYLDAGVGQLLDELRTRRLSDKVLLVVTADHGQALGEHGVVGPCRAWPHEELIHVPLLARLPGEAQAGRRIAALTQSVDLLPTLLEAFGQPAPADVHGRSLWPLLRGEAASVRPYACAGLRLGEAVDWALRTPEWAFLLPVQTPADEPARTPQLYGKPDDRWEVNNVVQHHLELAEHLEQVLRDYAAASHRPGPLEAPTLRNVEAAEAQEGGAEGT